MAEHVNWHTTPGMDSQYLGEWDLPEKQDMIVKIKDIGMDVIQGQNGLKEEKIVISFDGVPKKMICNKTNIRNIAAATGTDYFDEMTGHYVELFRDTASVGGKVVKCIRVRDFEPAV